MLITAKSLCYMFFTTPRIQGNPVLCLPSSVFNETICIEIYMNINTHICIECSKARAINTNIIKKLRINSYRRINANNFHFLKKT